MAQTENGIGISWKLQDGTMVWARRDDWAELTEDIKLIKGEAYLASLEGVLRGGAGGTVPAQGAPASPPPVLQAVPDPLTPEQASEALGGGNLSETAFQECPRCHALKNKWVPPGFSQKTQKNYKGFYACPTQGCPGR